MRKNCNILAICSFVISVSIFVFTYFLFHYMGPDGTFGPMYHEAPAKPFITYLFGAWGVTFLFAAVMSLLVGEIFFHKK